jgi:hypothetical protein
MQLVEQAVVPQPTEHDVEPVPPDWQLELPVPVSSYGYQAS